MDLGVLQTLNPVAEFRGPDYGPDMSETAIYPFAWSPAFGRRMRRLREKFDGLPMRAVQEAGGPSESAQGRIENGPAADGPPVMVTEDAMRKYAQAYTALSTISGRSKAQTTWAHRLEVEESFIMALGAAGSAVADHAGMADRHWDIAEAVKKTALNTMVIGANLHRGNDTHQLSMVTAGRLERFPSWKDNHIAGLESNASAELFGQTAVTVAFRHPTVSITPAEAKLGGVGAPVHTAWPDQSSVKKQAHGRLDPIEKLIGGLHAARHRAAALNVDPADVEAVGSMIFLINVLTDHLNAEKSTDQEQIGPLETWRRYENTKRWDMLRELLPEQVAGAMPRTENMVAATSAVLRPWVNARSMPAFDLHYQVDAGKPIAWYPSELHSDPPLVAERGDLWVVDNEVLPAVRGLIASTHRFALVLNDTYIGTTDDLAEGPPHYWCHSGIHTNIVLIYHPRSGWRATQID